ncbi:MAG: iron-sulfur cluster assembly accessory protein [Acidobacteria bacterium]|nr:iron-sulfur cluster assembly accessory protein [Acidobacteriota bacterium]
MIEITGSAARVIGRQMTKQGFTDGGLRVAVKAGGCSGYSYVFKFEPAAKPTDHVFDGPDGVKVFVDPRSLTLLEGTVLDFDEHNLMATNFILRNPNARSACGCGTSFGV